MKYSTSKEESYFSKAVEGNLTVEYEYRPINNFDGGWFIRQASYSLSTGELKTECLIVPQEVIDTILAHSARDKLSS